MIELMKVNGETVACDSVSRGRQYPYLYIHTHALSWTGACEFFGDPESLEELTATETFTFQAKDEDGKEKTVTAEIKTVYRGFTQLHCVQESPLIDEPGELMIWLQRPEE